MVETEADISEESTTVTGVDWLPPSSGSPLPAPSQPYRASQQQNSTAAHRAEADSSCMEVEAAQRKLQEIEDR